MTGPSARPLLFLDVDGPLIPFGAHSYPLWSHDGPSSNPTLARLNPRHGPRLSALPCDLVWATAWEHEANIEIAPRIGLPQLPVLVWPIPDHTERAEKAEPDDLHWKTRTIVEWAAGRSFVWVDDEHTDADREWVAVNHLGCALLHTVESHVGLGDADFAVLERWLRSACA